MLHYCDKTGASIQHDTWLAHVLTPGYAVIHKEAGAGWEVEASWVGISCPALEHPPKPFLVQVFAVTRTPGPKHGPPNGSKNRTPHPEFKDVWCATAEMAIEVAERLAFDLREGVRV